MGKIPESIIPKAYLISKKVYNGELSMREGVDQLVGNNAINKSSARDYIYNFRYLKRGETFGRTLNTPSMEYYFEHLLEDYGTANLSKPLTSLMNHIEYIEGIRKDKTTFHEMRAIWKKYAEKRDQPILITGFEQLIQNIMTLENYLGEGAENEKAEALNLIRGGICFVAYAIGGETRFAPSRFLGYELNKIKKYASLEIDGRQTNQAINSILKSRPIRDEKLEEDYLEYCMILGTQPQPAFNHPRKYWKVTLEEDFPVNREFQSEFPEGKIVERMHRYRERNAKLIETSKQIYLNKFGKLFCQVCGFDFEKEYGDLGGNFIEGHHTVPVSEMSAEYKTKPEEIAMLCSNCHRMVHKKRPWLKMKDLAKILKSKRNAV